jgi:hypothetical protein
MRVLPIFALLRLPGVVVYGEGVIEDHIVGAAVVYLIEYDPHGDRRITDRDPTAERDVEIPRPEVAAVDTKYTSVVVDVLAAGAQAVDEDLGIGIARPEAAVVPHLQESERHVERRTEIQRCSRPGSR